MSKSNSITYTPETKCTFCKNSKCCTYITQQIDAPRSMHDFDHLLWQLSHRNVSLYQDDEGWFLLVDNPCRHLVPGVGCGIYETRPNVCRSHSNDYCELDAPAEESFKKYFPDYETLDAYCRKRFKKWDKRFE